MEYYSAIKNNEILLFATVGMDLKGSMLSGVSEAEKDKHSVITYMWNLKNNVNVYACI